ncbi:BIRC7_8 [Mytilus edulis]|uniref:BIRC7_8 n=1 Tax=Mytilus edulis TaxID=6550 RepID=A0A8S3TCC3_MYTED|nr:BIRC7_8 [Mytilus edulis]
MKSAMTDRHMIKEKVYKVQNFTSTFLKVILCLVYFHDQSQFIMENLYQPPHRPMKYPNMCITQSRVITFSSWENIDTACVESLVDAGFFYTGNEDHVRCFDCGIGLRSWEPEDDPMVEHARWSPACRFIIEKKGQEFIDAVQTAVRQLEAENLIGHSEFNTTMLNSEDTENKNSSSQSVAVEDILPCGRPPTAAERRIHYLQMQHKR